MMEREKDGNVEMTMPMHDSMAPWPTETNESEPPNDAACASAQMYAEYSVCVCVRYGCIKIHHRNSNQHDAFANAFMCVHAHTKIQWRVSW